MRFVVGRDIRSAWNDLRIYPNLLDLARSYRARPALFQSLVVLFEENARLDEPRFEAVLWDRLQSLSQKDEWLGQESDPRVSDDPKDPPFSLSFGGEGFFVVGLHPAASRPARRFKRPALVFNLHDQFEQLRAEGTYDKLRDKIIERDVGLAGTANPMLARHGSSSEASQYSGRVVGEDWVCPFSARDVEHGNASGPHEGARMIDPLATSRRLAQAALTMSATAATLAETNASAPEIISKRTMMIANAVTSPLSGNYGDLSRMMPEKAVAFSAAWTSVAAEMLAMQGEYWRAIMGVMAAMPHGRLPTMSEAELAMDRLSTANLRSVERVANLGSAALAPVARQVKTNAQRTRRSDKSDRARPRQ